MRFELSILGACCLAACNPSRTEKTPPDAGADAARTAPAPAPKNPFAELHPTEIGRHPQGVTHLAFSADGGMLLSAGRDKTIRLWNPDGGPEQRVLAGHAALVAMASFSPDGRLVASASADETVRVWDVATGKQKLSLREPPPPKPKDEEEAKAQAAIPPPQANWAVFSADGKQIIAAYDDFSIRVWDAASGKKLRHLRDDGCRQRSVHLRRDAPGLVSAAGCMDDGVTYLRFWDDAGNLQNSQGNETQDAHFIAFDRQNRFLVAADGSAMLSVYSAQGSFLKKVLMGTYHFCLAFGPDDKTLLVGTAGGEVWVFRPPGFEREGKLDTGEKEAVDALAVSPRDGSLVVGLRNGRILRFAAVR